MNDIRKNNEKEEIIIKAKCKMPTVYKVILGIVLGYNILLFLIGIISINYAKSSPDTFMSSVCIAFGLIGFVIALIFLLVCGSVIRKSFCLITNKTIRGLNAGFLSAKNYSYRLDKIDNVEITSSIGIHNLVLNFDQGNTNYSNSNPLYRQGTRAMGGGAFIVRYLANPTQVFNKLNDLLGSIKTDKDVQVDIEMKKIEVEEKKADALAKIMLGQTPAPLQTSTKSDYIEELKSLKGLLDSGVISQEEFDKKKKELLEANDNVL